MDQSGICRAARRASVCVGCRWRYADAEGEETAADVLDAGEDEEAGQGGDETFDGDTPLLLSFLPSANDDDEEDAEQPVEAQPVSAASVGHRKTRIVAEKSDQILIQPQKRKGVEKLCLTSGSVLARFVASGGAKQ